MPKIKVNINGETKEVDKSDLTLPDKWGIVTPDNVPDGYVTKEKFQSEIQERLSNAKNNAKDELKSDEDFHKSILSQYNIALDDEGNPKGLEPTVDIDEVRSQERQRVADEYENKLEELESRIQKRNQSVVSNAIFSATSGQFEDYWLDTFGESDTPLVVEKFQGRFEVGEDGREYAVDKDGNKMFNNEGEPVRAKDFFQNEEKFGKYYKDKRQRGSNFNGPGNPTNGTPKGDPSKWSRDKKLKYIDQHGQDGYKQAIKKHKQSQKEN
jgi:hypothetical protein